MPTPEEIKSLIKQYAKGTETKHFSTELIEALFNLAVSYATAPNEWIDKSNSVYRMLGESENDYQERLKYKEKCHQTK